MRTFFRCFWQDFPHRFSTTFNVDFARPDKVEWRSANEVFNTFCEWLDGSPLSAQAPLVTALYREGRDRGSGSFLHHRAMYGTVQLTR